MRAVARISLAIALLAVVTSERLRADEAALAAKQPAGQPASHHERNLQRVWHDPHCPGCDLCDTSPPEDQAPQVQPNAPPEVELPISSSFGAAAAPQSSSPAMLGDYLGNVGTSAQIVFTDTMFTTFTVMDAVSPFLTRTFKVGEGEFIRPVDRIYGQFNYFHNVDSDITRFQLGLEKTFFNGWTSLGVRVPVFVVNPDAYIDGGGTSVGAFGSGTTTQGDLGDVSLIFKLALIDPQSPGALTVGVAVTPPTGPATLADVTPLFTTNVSHDGTIQPFFGAVAPLPANWFLHGFSSLDVPFDSDDAVYWFNDVGVGRVVYLLGPVVTALVPTLETHVNAPLNNRRIPITGVTPAAQNLTGLFPVASAIGNIKLHSQVNLTAGLTVELNRRSTLSVGYVVPLVKPNPFDGEFLLQYQWFGWRGSPIASLQGF